MTTTGKREHHLDHESCYRAVKSRDRRFDGIFYTAVRTTGIYCRPSCPAITPKRGNVSFFHTAAGAQGAGYRACRRCLPDATPGSPPRSPRSPARSRTAASGCGRTGRPTCWVGWHSGSGPVASPGLRRPRSAGSALVERPVRG